jgi:TRAP-type C4-dicarboxylate transport system substrate-binding protein
MIGRIAAAATAVAVTALTFDYGARAAEPVMLKFAFPPPPQSQLYTWGIKPWIEEVEKASAGTLEIKFFPGPTLANSNNVLDRVASDVAQMAFGALGAYGDQFAKSNVVGLPFLTTSDEKTSVALWRLYDRGILDEAYGLIRPLALFVFPPAGIHSNTRINSLDDLKGMKAAVFGRAPGQMLELLGATPVAMPTESSYQAAQRGLVSAIMTGWSAVLPFKLQDVVHQHLDAALGHIVGLIMMNKGAYAALPEAARKAIDAHSGESFSRYMGHTTDRMNALGGTVVCKQKGQTCYELSPEQAAIWEKRLAPLQADWLKRTPDGAKILEAYKAELAKLDRN